MRTTTALLTLCGVVVLAITAGRAARAEDQNAGDCIAIVTPAVEGVTGASADVAAGLRDLFAGHLRGPSLKVIPLEAKLRSLAGDEARLKGCTTLLLLRLTRKSHGRGLVKALGQAAGASSWSLPGGGSAGSAAARATAAGGLQAASSIAQSTKAKDEVSLEYWLESAGGQVQFGPRTEGRTARVDGEDLLTPVVARAAEAIVTRKGAR